MTNVEKAKELCCGGCVFENKGLRWCETCTWETIGFSKIKEFANWKDEQFETAINEIKANVIEARDNKEYYATNRETTLNWILRLIDECCENVSMQKGE